MMDLSDGLSTDLPRLCAASGVGARVEASRIPGRESSAAESASKMSTPSHLALNGGDDYELLFTVRPGKTRQYRAPSMASRSPPSAEISRSNLA